MKRLLGMLLAIGALALFLGGACSKEEKAGDKSGAAETAGESGEETGAEQAEEEPAAEGEEPEPAGSEDGAEETGEGAMTGIEACDALIEKMLECDKLPPATRESYKKAAEGWKQAIEAGGEQARSTIEQSCEQAESAWTRAFESAGC